MKRHYLLTLSLTAMLFVNLILAIPFSESTLAYDPNEIEFSPLDSTGSGSQNPPRPCPIDILGS